MNLNTRRIISVMETAGLSRILSLLGKLDSANVIGPTKNTLKSYHSAFMLLVGVARRACAPKPAYKELQKRLSAACWPMQPVCIIRCTVVSSNNALSLFMRFDESKVTRGTILAREVCCSAWCTTAIHPVLSKAIRYQIRWYGDFERRGWVKSIWA